jgi:hypothetical protein
MSEKFAALAAIMLLVSAPRRLSAKGDTVRIVISGGDLATPVEITERAGAARFEVWSGPGTSSNEAQGLNVDWSRGIARPPQGLQTYEVSFVTTRRDPGTYVVRYAIDRSTNHGYVYIPGKTDAACRDNVWLIDRGIEGNWFHAWSEWEKLAHPLIARARR